VRYPAPYKETSFASPANVGLAPQSHPLPGAWRPHGYINPGLNLMPL